MKSLLWLWLAVFEAAQPGYQYEFPRDHFSHPNYQTEWWYYTGNLRTAAGRQFGFELTFFRHAMYPGPPRDGSPWEARDLYLAHVALTDVDRHEFYSEERLNRAGPGLAGVAAQQGRYWNGNWEARWTEHKQQLRAVTQNFAFQLDLSAVKPFVIHGRNGVSQKSGEHASHYISYPRLTVTGQVDVQGQRYAVTGLAWRDHEFFSGELGATQLGWDWFSIHLNNGDDLMLYRLREKSGLSSRYSAGTYIDERGKATLLDASDIQLTPGRTWISPATKAGYPVEWSIRLPSLGLDLSLRPWLDRQELTSPNRAGPSYWEGGVAYAGKKGTATVQGEGYLEMTGYDQRLQFSNGGKFAVR